jgi:hypothetical protein
MIITLWAGGAMIITLWAGGAMAKDLSPQCGGEEFKSP